MCWRLNTDLDTVSVGSAGEQDAEAELVGARTSVLLAFEHLDVVDVAPALSRNC